jgi:hypothetical protein
VTQNGTCRSSHPAFCEEAPAKVEFQPGLDLRGLSPSDYLRVRDLTAKKLEIWNGRDGEADDETFTTLARKYFALKKKVEG